MSTTTSVHTRGFTLIEMIVAVALFAVVITIALPTLVIVMKASARSQAVQTTIENTSFAMDAISRQVRLGRRYYCTSDDILPSENLPMGVRECSDPDGGSTLVFTDQYNKRIAYRMSTSGSIEARSTSTPWIAITSPHVNIKEAKFTVNGATFFDGIHPSVRFVVRGSITDPSIEYPDFYLQTTMTQYSMYDGFAFRKIAFGSTNAPSLSLSAGDRFCSAVSGMRDMNNDSINDIIVGAEGRNGSGELAFLTMNRNGKVSNIEWYKPSGPSGVASGYKFGASMTSVGDIDGDGFDDLAIGAPGDGNGSVYVLFRATTLASTTALKISNPDSDSASFGRAVVYGGFDAGSHNILVLSDRYLFTLRINVNRSYNGSTRESATASTTLTISDVNGDGVADRIRGLPSQDSDQGAIALEFLGAGESVQSTMVIGNGTNGGPILAGGDEFGYAFSGLGDLNGDNKDDVVACAPGDFSDRGALYILFAK